MSYFQDVWFFPSKEIQNSEGTSKIFIVSTPKNHRTGLEVGTFATKNHKEVHG